MFPDKLEVSSSTSALTGCVLSEYGAVRLRQTVGQALELGCSNVESVRYLLNGTNQEQRPPLSRGGGYRSTEPVYRPQPSLEDYERLRPNWAVTEVIQ